MLARSNLTGSCTVNDVLITAGTAEANFLAVTQLVQPGRRVHLRDPRLGPKRRCWGKAIGAGIKLLPRDEARGWRFDMGELETLITERTRLIFLCNPNNPTGQVMREEEMLEVIHLAERVGAYVLCDEVYAGLEWKGGACSERRRVLRTWHLHRERVQGARLAGSANGLAHLPRPAGGERRGYFAREQ